MSDLAIRVEGLSKLYRIGPRERYTTLRDTLMDALKVPLWILRDGKRETEDGRDDTVWALKEVSFEIKRGEVMGIIGRNGAGKSTLLKILSRITEPTEGYAEIHGRVGTLLEVSTGFHPELTGRENVYLSGAILGMKKAEINRKFDEIVAFAEVEKFIDTPVKRYSSGMYLRLAFAVAAHLEPEVLLVDEVLAVGDAAFQKKCLGRMEDVAKQGRTVLFVSHNMETIQKLCHRCVWIEQGKIILDGNTDLVVSRYLNEWHRDLRPYYRIAHSTTLADEQKACLFDAEILNAEGVPCQHLRFGEPFTIHMLWKQWSDIPGVAYAIRVYDEGDRFLIAVNTINTDLEIESKGMQDVLCKFDYNVLVPGEYYISIGSYIRPHTDVQVVDPCLKLVVVNVPYRPDIIFNIVGNPVFALHPSWNKNDV